MKKNNLFDPGSWLTENGFTNEWHYQKIGEGRQMDITTDAILVKLYHELFSSRFVIDEELLQQAVEKWGQVVQTNKIQEEALELSLIINQMNCPTKDPAEMEDQLYGELADMAIMCAYFPIMFDHARIQSIIDRKLDVLKQKINE